METEVEQIIETLNICKGIAKGRHSFDAHTLTAENMYMYNHVYCKFVIKFSSMENGKHLYIGFVICENN